MICRVCQSHKLVPLWTDADGYAWRRCAACQSDTSRAEYDTTRYGSDYVTDLIDGEGPQRWHALANHAHNGDMIDRHHTGRPGRTMLDVGCGHGASGDVMRARGWATVGWDIDAGGRPAGTVVSAKFRADLFERGFDAALCREVLEHTPDPHSLLRELFAVTAPGGVCEITTPRPVDRERGPVWVCYHWAHLAVWHPDPLLAELVRVGFEILETDLWELGQRYLCRRPNTAP